ncbi:MAG: transcription antitermination factor NusB [Armatimonadetes bacterium]|nr:transcription antitermination factor NusB [Armatimonadota bacterium]
MPSAEAQLSIRERRLAREEAFKLVFQADQGVVPFDDILALERSETALAPGTWEWASNLAVGAWVLRDQIDVKLDKLAAGWTVERMASADRAVLRLSAYEVLYRDDIPVGVSINEAVELAKRYGTDESPRFINGILGNLARGQGDETQTTDPQ